MQKLILIVFVLCCVSQSLFAQPGKKYDSTMKLGKVGYKVYCSNKGMDKNSLTISPIGFENTAHDVTFEVKGRVNKAEVDDLNRDGFPDLLVYVSILGDKSKLNIIGVSSDNNQGFRPIYFPDILDDPKVKIGYKGNDEYYLMEGTLVRRFPVYNLEDTANIRPNGMYRQVMYKVVSGDRGELKFKVARSYDFARQQ